MVKNTAESIHSSNHTYDSGEARVGPVSGGQLGVLAACADTDMP